MWGFSDLRIQKNGILGSRVLGVLGVRGLWVH